MATVIYKVRRKSSIGSALRQAAETFAKGMQIVEQRKHNQEMQEDRQKHQFDYLARQSELNLSNTMTAKRYEQTNKNNQKGKDA